MTAAVTPGQTATKKVYSVKTFTATYRRKVKVYILYQNHGVSVSLHTWDHLPSYTSEHTPPEPQPDRSVLNLPTVEGWKAELAY